MSLVGDGGSGQQENWEGGVGGSTPVGGRKGPGTVWNEDTIEVGFGRKSVGHPESTGVPDRRST